MGAGQAYSGAGVVHSTRNLLALRLATKVAPFRQNFALSAVNCKLSAWLIAPFWLEFSLKPSSSIPAIRFPGFAKRAISASNSTSTVALSAPMFFRPLRECACSLARPAPAANQPTTNIASGLMTSSSAAAKSCCANSGIFSTTDQQPFRTAGSAATESPVCRHGISPFSRKVIDTQAAKLQYPRH